MNGALPPPDTYSGKVLRDIVRSGSMEDWYTGEAMTWHLGSTGYVWIAGPRGRSGLYSTGRRLLLIVGCKFDSLTLMTIERALREAA